LNLAIETIGSPSIAVSDSMVHVIWPVWNSKKEMFAEMVYRRSKDNGSSWEPPNKLETNAYEYGDPKIVTSGLKIFLVWVKQESDSVYYLYSRRSLDGGINWGPQTKLLDKPAKAMFYSIAASGSKLHLVWTDKRFGDWSDKAIYYKRSTDAGITWESETRLPINPEESPFAPFFIAISGSAVHVAWLGSANSHSEVYYKQNPTGN
jgi:hypothetical protein